MEKEIKQYEADTVVRVKRTGLFALILKRCYCGNSISMPVHYEAKFEDGGISIVNHADVELECLPLTITNETYTTKEHRSIG